ncbi:MAG: NAD(P)/FAD-dependent oxidoreductase [Alphaproteobacteria bacterium]|nr:NAD(P)/FAD-dependent oxidoreductase [Alphaproteobacteria bacterium]MCB9930430.1 NAD(P)/FAD-dependent oxidoreductase [Alphaproteobacteria bacterium]
MSALSEKAGSVDAVVVGAGFAGLYLLHRFAKQGVTTRCFERGDSVGGTWYWNRYPGARCDVESMQYSYGFDEDLQQEWHWPEKFSAQADILAYANHVCDRFGLRDRIDFETEVRSARFDAATRRWQVTTDTGETVTARFFIMATGCISTAQIPKFDGLADYQGETYHTGNWPHEPVSFKGKRVAVIGTGSSGIQAIPVIAEEAAHLTVFQRQPNFSIPARNMPMTEDYAGSWKDGYAGKRAEMRYQPNGVLREVNDQSALAVSEDERQRIYEERWEAGTGAFLGAFNDILTDKAANDTMAEFVRNKIRATVNDPVTAERLCPKTHPIGTKRICIDNGYYQTFNRANVELVDISEQPISRLTETGLVVGERAFPFDAIVFATGFDAMTGTLFNVDIRGRDGLELKKKWEAGPRTYLGLMSEHFPNMFMITGPGSPSVKGNMINSIEQHVELVTDTVQHMRDAGLDLIEPEAEAEDEWVDHVQVVAHKTLFPQANSWYMGANIPGKPRLFMPYIAGVGVYRRICEAAVAEGYKGFRFEAQTAMAAE